MTKYRQAIVNAARMARRRAATPISLLKQVLFTTSCPLRLLLLAGGQGDKGTASKTPVGGEWHGKIGKRGVMKKKEEGSYF